MERWVAIEGYEEYYEVSDLGRVRNKVRGTYLKPGVNDKGYLQVDLMYKGRKCIRLHQLVMRHFNPQGYFEGAEVDHLDGDKKNNVLSNLEWVTHEENVRRMTVRLKDEFIAVSPWGVEMVYALQSDVCEDYPELDFRHVSACLQGKLPQHKGWKFYYKEESKRKTFKKTYRSKPFIGTSPEGVEYEGNHQADFAKEHGLKFYGVNNCLIGKTKSHKGWTFRYKEENNG